MSEISNTYACDTCTYVQSIDVAKCELCGTLNPNRSKSAKSNDIIFGDGAATCSKCSFINNGDHIRVCEMCGHDLRDQGDSAKRFRADKDETQDDDEEEEDDDDDDDDDYNDYDDGVYQIQMPKSKDKQPKKIEAVETAMNDDELRIYFNQYQSVLKEQRQQTKTFPEKQLHDMIVQLFHSLQYKNDMPDGQLVFRHCQICFDKDEPVVTMKACGHRMICPDCFHQYLSTRIRDGELQPWIPCPAETCSVPCDSQNITGDGRLTHSELLSFITTYMLKKLSRNENFLTCVHCEQGGFLQFGPPKKESVVCEICNSKQTIEKGSDGDLDIAFKQMIQSGHLRECPTCRLLTLKEKGLCNVIECAKCGIWWNWRTREQGHSGKDLKQRARMNGTLWEPGELSYQQDLQRRNPQEFKALLERNGIKYDPNYVRGGWNDQ